MRASTTSGVGWLRITCSLMAGACLLVLTAIAHDEVVPEAAQATEGMPAAVHAVPEGPPPPSPPIGKIDRVRIEAEAKRQYAELKGHQVEVSEAEYVAARVAAAQRRADLEADPSLRYKPGLGGPKGALSAWYCTNGDFEHFPWSPLGLPGFPPATSYGPYVSSLQQGGWHGAYGDRPYHSAVDFNALQSGLGCSWINSVLYRHHTWIPAGMDFSGAPIPVTGPDANGNPSAWAVQLGDGMGGPPLAQLLAKTFVVVPGQEYISFHYAVILDDAWFVPIPEYGPFFQVRVLDGNSEVQGLVWLGGSIPPGQDKLTYSPGDPTWDIVNGRIFKKWACGQIDLSSLIGHTVTIQFITAKGAEWNWRGYAYLDNICSGCKPGSASCCPGPNLVANGDFSAAPAGQGNHVTWPGVASQYGASPAWPSINTVPGTFNVVTSSQALAISPSWKATDHTECQTIYPPGTGKFMVVNGLTCQPIDKYVWRQQVPIKPRHFYSFCARAKNFPQCTFDIKPKVGVRFIAMPQNTQLHTFAPVEIDTAASSCDWQLLSTQMRMPAGSTHLLIEIWLVQQVFGDGNDLALDDIGLHDIHPIDDKYTKANIVKTPIGNNHYTLTATPEENIAATPGYGYFWSVKELDCKTGEELGASSQIINPWQWWHEFPCQFEGYLGYGNTLGPVANGSGPIAGVFDDRRCYRITYGAWSQCAAFRIRSWDYGPLPGGNPNTEGDVDEVGLLPPQNLLALSEQGTAADGTRGFCHCEQPSH